MSALRRAESAFRTLLDDLPDGAIVHRAGIVIYINRLANSWLGYDDQDAVVGRPVLSIIHPGDRESVAERGRDVMNGRPTPLKEQRLLHRDGHTVVVEVAAMRAIFDGAPAILALGRDITERKKLEARLVVSDRLASIGRLASAVGHEINNPLTYVIGNLELVQKDLARVLATAPPDAANHVRERMAVVREGVERVRTIVLDLKALARPDTAETSRIDVARVLDVCANMAEHELRGRARLVRDYAPGLYADASEAQLAQAFLNVLLNAAQAIPRDADAVDANEIRVSAHRESATAAEGGGDVLAIAISDTGIGISREIESRIFEPFFSTKGPGGGAGLGLSICHNVVSTLGGTLDHVPNEPRGTTFRIRLPAAPMARLPSSGAFDAGAPDSLALPSSPGLVAASAPRPRVLVVDDEPNLAKLIAYCLEAYDVTVVHSGRAAIDAMVEGPGFDAVVCDLVMDDLTGMDVFEHVRRTAPGNEGKMIFMTGGAYTPAARAFVAEVANPVLEKPFEAQRIEALIRNVLHKGAARNGA